MKYYSHDDVYGSLEAMTPLSIEQIEVAMNSLTPVSTPDRERIRMEVWRDTYTQALAMVNYNSMNYHEAANNALAAFDKQFPNR